MLLLIAVAIIGNGVDRFLTHTAPSRIAYYNNADKVLKDTAEFVAQEVPGNGSVATTDWGVIPRIIKRRSYTILNDNYTKLITRRVQHILKNGGYK